MSCSASRQLSQVQFFFFPSLCHQKGKAGGSRGMKTLCLFLQNFTFRNHHGEKTFPWGEIWLASGWYWSTAPEMCCFLKLTLQELMHDMSLFMEKWKLLNYLPQWCDPQVNGASALSPCPRAGDQNTAKVFLSVGLTCASLMLVSLWYCEVPWSLISVIRASSYWCCWLYGSNLFFLKIVLFFRKASLPTCHLP